MSSACVNGPEQRADLSGNGPQTRQSRMEKILGQALRRRGNADGGDGAAVVVPDGDRRAANTGFML